MPLVNHFLQLKKRCGFMAANVTEIIRACASQRQRFRILKFLDINLVISRVAVILYPENGRAKKVIIFNQFYKSNSVNFFPPPYHLIRSMGIYVLQKMW